MSTIAENITINVPQVQVNSTFAYDGEKFAFSIYELANFYLRPDGTDEQIHLSPSYTPLEDVMVIPGIYDVIYVHQFGSTYAPNELAVIQDDVEINARDPDLDINVEVCTVAPVWQLAIDGGAVVDFPQSVYTSAEFYLRNDAGDYVRLGVSYQDGDMVDVVEGTTTWSIQF